MDLEYVSSYSSRNVLNTYAGEIEIVVAKPPTNLGRSSFNVQHLITSNVPVEIMVYYITNFTLYACK
jgi:hypothetical protein